MKILKEALGSVDQVVLLCQQILGQDYEMSHITSVFETKSKPSKAGDFKKFLA